MMALVVPILAYVLTPDAYGVADVEWNDAGAFGAGQFTNATTTEDTVTLSQDLVIVDDTALEFAQGKGYYVDTSDGVSAYLPDDEKDLSDDVLLGRYRRPYTNYDLIYSSRVSDNGVLYVSDYDGGLTIFDTKGTPDIGDDNFLGIYNTATVGFNARSSYFSTSHGDALYSAGIIIDTKGTLPITDDTNEGWFSSIGARPGFLRKIITDGDMVYIASSGGVSVVDTNGTPTLADDALEAWYTSTSTPVSLPSPYINDVQKNGNTLYIATYKGVTAIDTNGTPTSADDVFAGTLNATSSPALSDAFSDRMFMYGDILYVSYVNGVDVVDTKGTATTSDDTVEARYTPSSNPAVFNYVAHISLDGELLYVSSEYNGVTVIDTQGTPTISDDTLHTTYTETSIPSIGHYGANAVHSLVHKGVLYASDTNRGLHAIQIDKDPDTPHTYTNISREISTVGTSSLTLNVTQNEDHTVSLQYRTGTGTKLYVNEFDDATTTEYLGDWDNWGSTFLSAAESNGTLKLSGPESNDNYFWIDTGFPDDYLPGYSRVSARVRVNSDTALYPGELFFVDDWSDSDDDGEEIPLNEWFILDMSSGVDELFSKIGFNVWFDTGTWAPTDTFEIDWIRVETPDSFGGWSSWSDPCTSTTCAIDPADLTGQTWIQYRLNLETTDPSTTPIIHSVAYTNGYHSSGTYISNEEVISARQQPLTFSADDTTPDGTTIAYTYSTDSGSTWHTLSNPHTFDPSFTPSTFMWKAEMTTDHATETPSISSVVLTMGMQASHTGTAISRRVQALEAEGKQIEANILRSKYPHLFTDTANTRQLEQIVSLLKEVVMKWEMLVEVQKNTQ
jgi:hypothetical protein